MVVKCIGVDATALLKNRTGVGNYVFPILKALLDIYPQIRLILYSNEEIFFPKSDRVSFRVSKPKRRGPFWQNTQLNSMLKHDAPDVFWGTNGLLPLFMYRPLPTVLTVHDLVYKFAPQTLPFHSLWGRRIFQPLGVKSATRVVAVSQATANDMRISYGRSADALVPPLPSTGLSVVTNDQIRSAATKLNLPLHYLLSLGTLEPRKNLATLVRAYMTSRQAGVQLPVLVLAGGKGWMDSDIESTIISGEQEGVIRRLGYVDVDDLQGLYAGCDAFLMPSIYEGYGMPLLEAQLCGAPVIHGVHDSMREASDNLGVVCGTNFSDICNMFNALSLGQLPLTCRISSKYTWNVETAAVTMWEQFNAAYNIAKTGDA